IRGASMETATHGSFSRFSISPPARPIEPNVHRQGTADFEIEIPPDAFEGVNELLLSIEYEGDVGNAFIDGTLIADDFYNGTPWEIGLKRFQARLLEKGLYIHVTPRREGTLVIRESGMALQQELRGREIARLGAIKLIAVREAVIDAG
ncbi:MAG: hypothetical protein ABSG21_17175, partial [Spirochaetia bacterium]